jgi:riboflavin kinase/FMN adenylyltransferase
MIVFRSPAEIPTGYGPSVVTVGKFDGVHTGHRSVIDQVRASADRRGAQAVVVTFDRNPLAVLRPQACPPDVVGPTQKERLLAETGIDATLVLTFDAELAALTPREFVDRVLLPLGVVEALVGVDFRFGHRAAGTPQVLAELGEQSGFTVRTLADVAAPGGGRRVSSTWVREALAAGDVATAAELLGRPHAVRGEVVHGAERGHELGFPTANLAGDSEGMLPAEGVYAAWLVDERMPDTALPAAVSVGLNPTFGELSLPRVEAYVLDRDDLDLYGAIVEIRFVARVRPMVAFADPAELVSQMRADVAEVRVALGVAPPAR